MSSVLPLLEQFRTRLLSELHIGHLRAGDRLPPIRELARELGGDHRAIAEAYRRLAEEGLVELRGRSGAFVASQRRVGGELVEETARWLATALTEARKRRITIPNFPSFIERCTASKRLRCVCIDSTEDSLLALTAELSDDFGFEVAAMSPAALVSPLRRNALPEEVLEADLLVTNRFHGPVVTKVGKMLGKPVIIASLAPELSRVIERKISETGLTVIAADPRYGDRFLSLYASTPWAGANIRIVLASDSAGIARLDRSDPVLATRAARRHLPDLDLPLLLNRYPSISAESARSIIECLIRLNLEDTPPA